MTFRDDLDDFVDGAFSVEVADVILVELRFRFRAVLDFSMSSMSAESREERELPESLSASAFGAGVTRRLGDRLLWRALLLRV